MSNTCRCGAGSLSRYCGDATVCIVITPKRFTACETWTWPGPQAEKDLAKRQSNFDAAKNIRPEIIQLGMESAISSGNWTIKRFRMERKGVSQVHTLPEGLAMSSNACLQERADPWRHGLARASRALADY